MHRHIIPDVISGQHVCTQLKTNSAFEAAEEMTDCDVAGIVVVDANGKLEGIVTERDLTRRVMRKKLDPMKTTLNQIMTKDPDTLSPNDTALTALKMMRSRFYRHLPVVDGGRVVGMVSIRDLYAAVTTELEEDIHETEAFVFGDRYGV